MIKAEYFSSLRQALVLMISSSGQSLMWKHTQESAECSEYAIQVMWYGTM